jgi:serpin B
MSYIENGSFDFALKLFECLSKEDQNLVLSPFSLTCALSMTLLGTRNNSCSQLSKTLFGKEIAVNEFDSMASQMELIIDKTLKLNSKVLQNANFIYSHLNFPILPEFRQKIEKQFNGQSRELDFISAQNDSIKTINNDISNATKGKIPKLIDILDSMTRIIIVNAIHFKGLWKSQFKTESTSVQKFTTSSGEVEVEMMFQESKFPFGYSQQLKCKAIELKYETSNISMIVLLPDQNSSLKELESKLETQSLNDLLNSLSQFKVSLSLPKFKLESSLHLIPALTKLGIKDIFSHNVADLSGLTKDPSGLYVSDVIQKAVIEVNEEGTEAAAATAVTITLLSLDMTEEFRVNRPFMFLLVAKYEEYKNLILFMGSVNNPKI